MDNVDFLTSADHLVVVVAHPDDETFGCGSIVALAAERGARVSIVCATRGEAGEPSGRVDIGARTLGDVREEELRRAAAILGAHHVELLGYADSGFDGPCAPGTLCDATQHELVRRLHPILDRLAPTVIVTLDGCDGHRDHVHLRDVVLACAHRAWPVYLATIPNSVMCRWLDEKLAGGDASAYHAIDRQSIGSPDEATTLRLDVSHVLPTRLAAIAAHASQRSPFDGLSEPLRDAFLCTEHLIAT